MDDPQYLRKSAATRPLSQEDPAHELGVSYATVNRWENGLSKFSKLARGQLDAFCERIQKEGFLVLSPEQDSI
jgi:DNA-binding transcriptional regulator YiaG